MNDTYRKTISRGTVNRGFTVCTHFIKFEKTKKYVESYSECF